MKEILVLIVKETPDSHNKTYYWNTDQSASKDEILESLKSFKELIEQTPEEYWRGMGV